MNTTYALKSVQTQTSIWSLHESYFDALPTQLLWDADSQEKYSVHLGFADLPTDRTTKIY